jgi:predicted LPLAT superfamily acyltransferase
MLLQTATRLVRFLRKAKYDLRKFFSFWPVNRPSSTKL